MYIFKKLTKIRTSEEPMIQPYAKFGEQIKVENRITNKSKKLFFISECLVNQNIRAYGVHNTLGSGPVAALMELFIKLDIGIAIVPCPEIPYEGLKRRACGKLRYCNDSYRDICLKQAEDFLNRLKLYADDKYKIYGFICIDGSPSCGLNYCFGGYDGKEKICESGVFIEILRKKLEDQDIHLKFIGFHKNRLTSIIDEILTINDSAVNKKILDVSE